MRPLHCLACDRLNLWVGLTVRVGKVLASGSVCSILLISTALCPAPNTDSVHQRQGAEDAARRV